MQVGIYYCEKNGVYIRHVALVYQYYIGLGFKGIWKSHARKDDLAGARPLSLIKMVNASIATYLLQTGACLLHA